MRLDLIGEFAVSASVFDGTIYVKKRKEIIVNAFFMSKITCLIRI